MRVNRKAFDSIEIALSKTLPRENRKKTKKRHKKDIKRSILKFFPGTRLSSDETP